MVIHGGDRRRCSRGARACVFDDVTTEFDYNFFANAKMSFWATVVNKWLPGSSKRHSRMSLHASRDKFNTPTRNQYV